MFLMRTLVADNKTAGLEWASLGVTLSQIVSASSGLEASWVEMASSMKI